MKISKTAAMLIATKQLHPEECGQGHKSGAKFFRGRTYIAGWGPDGEVVGARSVQTDREQQFREASQIRSQL